MDKKIIKFDDTETEEYEFHQYKSPVSIDDIDINEIVYIIKYLISFLFVNKILNILWVTNIIKKLDLYTYSLCISFMHLFKRCILSIKMKKIDKYRKNLGKC